MLAVVVGSPIGGQIVTSEECHDALQAIAIPICFSFFAYHYDMHPKASEPCPP